jgi:hypothetical protein
MWNARGALSCAQHVVHVLVTLLQKLTVSSMFLRQEHLVVKSAADVVSTHPPTSVTCHSRATHVPV